MYLYQVACDSCKSVLHVSLGFWGKRLAYDLENGVAPVITRWALCRTCKTVGQAELLPTNRDIEDWLTAQAIQTAETRMAPARQDNQKFLDLVVTGKAAWVRWAQERAQVGGSKCLHCGSAEIAAVDFEVLDDGQALTSPPCDCGGVLRFSEEGHMMMKDLYHPLPIRLYSGAGELLQEKCDLESLGSRMVGRPDRDAMQWAERLVEAPNDWGRLSGPDLLNLIVLSLIRYGVTLDQSLPPRLGPLYSLLVGRGAPKERMEVLLTLKSLLDEDKINAIALLPIVAHDDDIGIVSTATLDLVAYSATGSTGLPYGLTSLLPLLEHRALRNPGAVLGGLVTLGDSRLRIAMDAARLHMREPDVAVAARCRSGFVTHAAVDFWLSWCEEVVATGRGKDSLIGTMASALVNLVRGAAETKVREIFRSYPAQRSPRPIEVVSEWPLREYARLIQPRLERLAAREGEPKVFPMVMEAWGLR